MKKVEKIVETIFWAVGIVYAIIQSALYYIAFLDMDYDLMFVYGFNIMVATCIFVLTFLVTFIIFSIWSEDKKEK
jgi:uncharacterized membrane protein